MRRKVSPPSISVTGKYDLPQVQEQWDTSWGKEPATKFCVRLIKGRKSKVEFKFSNPPEEIRRCLLQVVSMVLSGGAEVGETLEIWYEQTRLRVTVSEILKN